jgi:hypothetical protein
LGTEVVEIADGKLEEAYFKGERIGNYTKDKRREVIEE